MIELKTTEELKHLALLAQYLLFKCLSLLLPFSQVLFQLSNVIMLVIISTIPFIETVEDVCKNYFNLNFYL